MFLTLVTKEKPKYGKSCGQLNRNVVVLTWVIVFGLSLLFGIIHRVVLFKSVRVRLKTIFAIHIWLTKSFIELLKGMSNKLFEGIVVLYFEL